MALEVCGFSCFCSRAIDHCDSDFMRRCLCGSICMERVLENIQSDTILKTYINHEHFSSSFHFKLREMADSCLHCRLYKRQCNGFIPTLPPWRRRLTLCRRRSKLSIRMDSCRWMARKTSPRLLAGQNVLLSRTKGVLDFLCTYRLAYMVGAHQTFCFERP